MTNYSNDIAANAVAPNDAVVSEVAQNNSTQKSGFALNADGTTAWHSAYGQPTTPVPATVTVNGGSATSALAQASVIEVCKQADLHVLGAGLDHVQLKAVADVLAQRRAVWELGAFKSSNAELIALLADCLGLYLHLLKFDTARREFHAIYKASGEAVIDQLERWHRSKNFFASRRLYIIEEFDRVHYESQLGFGHLMTTTDVQFIMTTNNVDNIDDRILSRARPCHISGATQQDMLKLARHVVTSEGVTATQAELEKLTVLSAGNVRDLMHDLEALVLDKRRHAVQTVASQVTLPSGVTAAMAQSGAGMAQAPSVLPTVSLIPLSTSMGKSTP